MAPKSGLTNPKKLLKPSTIPKDSILGGGKEDSLEENGTFCGKSPPTRRRSSSENIPKPKLAGVLGKYKLPITKLKRAGLGILYLFIQKF